MTNPLGGKNPNSLYVPMSEDEQEVLDRLVQADDLEVHILGWAVLKQPKVTFGDKRVAIRLQLLFNEPAPPAPPIPVYYFDMELRTRAGLVLFSERHPTVYDNKPLMIRQGYEIDMIWDIAIARMDPGLVKMFKPGAKGLTSRMTDRDTGDLTAEGNIQGDLETRRLLNFVKQGEKDVKANDEKKKADASRKATYRDPKSR